MRDEALYQVRHHLSSPFRILSLTIDELVVIIFALVTFFFLDGFVAKGLLVVVGSALVSILRFIKKGRGPKMLVVYLYWYLPSFITQFFMSKMPASYKRIWKA
jgi:conjugal transfer pilus assembly protein TraL